MKVLAFDISTCFGWVIANSEGEIFETGSLNEPEDIHDPSSVDEDEVAE